MWSHPRARKRQKHGNVFAQYQVKYMVSDLKRKNEEAKEKKRFLSPASSAPTAHFLSNFFFLFKMRRKRKHKQGNSGDKGRFLSAGALMWIKPGFGKVKWALAIKSRQAKRQEPLSLELKAKAGGSEGYRGGGGGGLEDFGVCM